MTAIQKEVWHKMLNAQLGEVYWSKKAKLISFRLRIIQLVAAIIGCGAFASLFTGPEFAPAKSVLGLVAAGMALYLSTFDVRGSLYQVEETKRKYAALFTKLEQLWHEVQTRRLSEDEMVSKLKPLIEEFGKIEEPHVIESKRLKNEAFNEICAARGLSINANA
jgi:hypothetical protein